MWKPNESSQIQGLPEAFELLTSQEQDFLQDGGVLYLPLGHPVSREDSLQNGRFYLRGNRYTTPSTTGPIAPKEIIISSHAGGAKSHTASLVVQCM